MTLFYNKEVLDVEFFFERRIRDLFLLLFPRKQVPLQAFTTKSRDVSLSNLTIVVGIT